MQLVTDDKCVQWCGGMQESMRLMPVVAVATIRVSHKDCTLGGGKCAFCFAWCYLKACGICLVTHDVQWRCLPEVSL